MNYRIKFCLMGRFFPRVFARYPHQIAKLAYINAQYNLASQKVNFCTAIDFQGCLGDERHNQPVGLN